MDQPTQKVTIALVMAALFAIGFFRAKCQKWDRLTVGCFVVTALLLWAWKSLFGR